MKITFKDGYEIHEVDDGPILYFQGGKCHRDDGPAKIFPNGDREWRSFGHLDRLEWANETKMWFTPCTKEGGCHPLNLCGVCIREERKIVNPDGSITIEKRQK